METTRIIYAIFAAACLLVASVVAGAAHVVSGKRLQEQWSNNYGPVLYFRETKWLFLIALLFVVASLVLAWLALRTAERRAA